MDNKKLISQDLESTVLGCMLLDSNCFEVSKELNLKPSDFYFTNTKLVYESMKLLDGKNSKIDLLTVSECLKEMDRLEDAGGVVFLSSLLTIVPTTSHIGEYIKQLKLLSNKRCILNEMSRIAADIEKLSLQELED